MQKANEIRHHINAVAETRKITNAMQLVASARIKRVIHKMEYNQTFLTQVQSVMKDMLLSPHLQSHPYLEKRPHPRRTYLVITGDKGMAGGYNLSVLQLAQSELARNKNSEITLITVGMMGDEFFRIRGRTPDVRYGGVTQDPSLHNARKITRDILERFDGGRTDQVFVIYTPFRGGMAGTPICHRILPLRLSDFVDIDTAEPAHAILYHPSEDEVFDALVPQFLVGYIFGALTHSYASEHSARMMAMQSATRNADEMLDKLRMQYNLARQAAVTQEIAEISSSQYI
ncbi:MAG: ATP synthase F1 subunit gamma [Oscillospiraceae bacterium]|jgi:F-type H+-transporting ATPase subunit gamma|nr:ATP synthase F1 subunit gamma [Oscillospiraceae bacterium]